MRRSIQGASPKRKRKITIPHDRGVQTSDAEIQDSVRESEPQQIELEMQNEDLRKSLTEVEEARRKYADLYDFAPIGYFTFDRKGCILEANATGAFLLGIDKRQLAGVPFISFLNSRYQTIFYSHLQKARELHKKQTRRVRLTRIDGHPFDALIETIAVTGASGKFDQYRSSILDLSEMGTLGEPTNDIDRKHRKLVEELQQGTWSIDRDGYTIFVNPRMAEMLGYTVDEMRGKHLFEFMNEEGKDIAAHYIERCRQGIKEQYDFEFISKDGTRIYGALESSPIFYDQGNYAGAVASVMDITERKQAEVRDLLAREVLELLNRLEGSPDTVRDILQLIKKNTCFEAVGIRLREGDDFPYYETNGFSEDFIQAERYLCARDEEGKIIRDGQGKPVLECMCGNILCNRTDPTLSFFTEGGSFWSNCTTELLASTTEKDRQARTRNRCNGEGYESVGLIPLRSGDEIIGLLQLNDRRHNQFTPEMIRFFEGLGASIGIALSRKQADEALRESEEKFRTIFENSSSAMAIISRDTTISMVNREYCKIGLFEEKDVIGKSWTAQIPPGDRERLKEYNRQRLIDPKSAPDHYEFTFYRKDGNIRHSLMSVAIIPTSQNIVCSFVDITDRKQAEADKEKLEVQNRQIQKAESLGRMAGAIAHTFNNQLGVVIGNLELALIELSQGARPHANITAAMSASNKAAEVSGLMLTYLGQSFDKREPLALSDACRWSLPMLRAVMPEDVVLETDLPSPGPAISTNANYIHQILSNLMTNAWESVGEEGGSIHLGVKTVSPADIPAVHRFPLDWQPQDNAYACLEVTDAGSGIADKDIEKIFDPFFSKKFTGRGMGLSVILGIVRTHGGVVTVESEPGRGSIFRVFFPVSAEEVDTAAQVPERRKLDRRRGYRT